MNEKERLSMRAKMLSWNKGFRTMQSVLDEFAQNETTLHLAQAMIGGSCACLLEKGYDHLTVNALLTAQASTASLWRTLHAEKKPRRKRKKTS
jgi:hypothetical protein